MRRWLVCSVVAASTLTASASFAQVLGDTSGFGVSALAGYATKDMNFGLGARLGYTLPVLPVYVGGTFVYHFGTSESAVLAGSSVDSSTKQYLLRRGSGLQPRARTGCPAALRGDWCFHPEGQCDGVHAGRVLWHGRCELVELRDLAWSRHSASGGASVRGSGRALAARRRHRCVCRVCDRRLEVLAGLRLRPTRRAQP